MTNITDLLHNKEQLLDEWNIHKKELATEELRSNNLRELESNGEYPKQGEIYWIEFGENIGYEFNSCHPGIVVSKNKYNKTGTTLVAPISSGKIKHHKHILRCHYILFKNKYRFLTKDCLIKCDQIRVISNFRLQDKMGTVNHDDWEKIQLRIKTTFDLK